MLQRKLCQRVQGRVAREDKSALLISDTTVSVDEALLTLVLEMDDDVVMEK